MSERKNRRRVGLVSAVLWFTMTAVFLTGGLCRPGQVSEEATISESVCHQLAADSTEGRQALVSSVWWAPLPFLARAPFAWLLGFGRIPFSALLISAAFGAGILLLLDHALRGWGFKLGRYLFMLAVIINPFFLRSAMNGSSETMSGFLALLATLGLAGWISTRKLRYLVFLATGTALLAITSFTMSLWGLALLGLLVIDLVFMKGGWRKKEAVIILGFLPLVYTVGIWILMNWLIMGDGLYFVRNLARSGRFPGDLTKGLQALGSSRPITALRPLGIHYVHLAAAAVVFLTMLVSLFRKSWAGICLGAAGLVALLFAAMTAGSGVYWDSQALLATLFLVCVLVVGFLARTLKVSGGIVGASLGCIPLLVSVAALLQFHVTSIDTSLAYGRAPTIADQALMASRLEQYVLRQSKYAKVFVCGYDGFLLLGSRANHLPHAVRGGQAGVYNYVLDLNINKIKSDYHGHVLFLLVHKPEGKSGTDSVHWQFDRLYTLGSRSTLFDSDWGDWRLFEIIQAAR